MVLLEPFSEVDIDRLLGWVEPTPKFLVQWAGRGFRFPMTRDQVLSHLEQIRPPHRILRVLDGDEVVGHSEIYVDAAHNYGRLSRLLIAPEQRGRGLGKEMIRALVELGFGELGLHRLELGVLEFNAAALRTYEAVGFRREGLMREARRIGETYWSVVEMAVLRDDWLGGSRRVLLRV